MSEEEKQKIKCMHCNFYVRECQCRARVCKGWIHEDSLHYCVNAIAEVDTAEAILNG